MLPVYNEFLEFLEVNGLDLDKYNLKEGYYWIGYMIIRAFDTDGNQHKICRVHVDEDFNISFSDYPESFDEFEMESWKDTVVRNQARLTELENESTDATKVLLDKYSDSTQYICHSGGKDSAVLNHIVRSVDSSIPILFNNTSNESADTYRLIKGLDNVKILNPEEGFWNYMKRKNYIPSRIARSCCEVYKHNLTLDNLNQDEKHLLFMGMRNSESHGRSEYETDHSFDYYPDVWDCGLPIRKWTDMDIWLYIIQNDIQINSIYKYGYSRCGCIICGYRSNLEELLTRHFFPTHISRFAKVQEGVFVGREKWMSMNCTLDEFMNKGGWKGGAYRKEPTEEVIKEFAEYKGLDLEVARSFFERTCSECEKEGKKTNVRHKDVLAMNLKYLGRTTNAVMCKRHLQEYLGELQGKNFTHSQWKKTVKEFESDGCELF